MDDDDNLTKEDLEAPLIGEDDDLLPEPPIPGPAEDDLDDDLDRELPPSDMLDDTHPATDTNIDPGTLEYNGGNLSDEAGVSEPNAGDAVVDYDPDKDEKKAA